MHYLANAKTFDRVPGASSGTGTALVTQFADFAALLFNDIYRFLKWRYCLHLRPSPFYSLVVFLHIELSLLEYPVPII